MAYKLAEFRNNIKNRNNAKEIELRQIVVKEFKSYFEFTYVQSPYISVRQYNKMKKFLTIKNINLLDREFHHRTRIIEAERIKRNERQKTFFAKLFE